VSRSGDVSLADVARRAGVSVSTASRVINGSSHPVGKELKRRVLAVARELDYYPSAIARSLRTARSQMAAVVVHDISDPYFGEVVRGAEDVANKRGYVVLVCNTDRNREKELTYIRMLRENRAAAVVFAGGGLRDPRHHKEIGRHLGLMRQGGTGVVALATQGLDLPAVRYDNRHAGRMAARYLVSRGHRKIAFFAGPEEIFTSHERLEGFRAGLDDAALPLDPSALVWSDFTRDGGARAVTELLESGTALGSGPRAGPSGAEGAFTCIMASNDEMAIGAMWALQERGLRVPEDVSVMGVGDIRPARYANPPLTTIRVGTYELGARGMALALNLAERQEARDQEAREIRETQETEVEIVERGSVSRLER